MGIRFHYLRKSEVCPSMKLPTKEDKKADAQGNRLSSSLSPNTELCTFICRNHSRFINLQQIKVYIWKVALGQVQRGGGCRD